VKLPDRFGGHKVLLEKALGDPRELKPNVDFTAIPQARRANEPTVVAEALPDRGWIVRLHGPINFKAGDLVILRQPGDAPAVTAVMGDALAFPRGSSRGVVLTPPETGVASDDHKLRAVFIKNAGVETIGAKPEAVAMRADETVKLPTLPKLAPRAAETIRIPTVSVVPAVAPDPIPAPRPIRITRVPRPAPTAEPMVEPAVAKVAGSSSSPWYTRIPSTDSLLAATGSVCLFAAASISSIMPSFTTWTVAEAAGGALLAGLAVALGVRSPKSEPSVSPARR
jgi:hypothetical protein